MPDERAQYGGQAVVEGVMMRSPRFFAVACRRLSDGRIVLKREPVEKHLRRVQWLNKPFLRGTLALIDAMALGMKALTYAANVQAADQPIDQSGAARQEAREEARAAGAVDLAMGEGALLMAPPAPNTVDREGAKTLGDAAGGRNGTLTPPELGVGGPSLNGGPSQTISGIAIGATTVVALALGFGLFWTLPALATDKLLPHLAHLHTAGSRLGANLVEGGIRLIIFFLYIGLISRMKHVQRVFQYHGAEHKAINTLESGLPVTVGNARAASRIHPRCGTNFIFIVLVTAIVVFSVIPRHALSEGVGPVLQTVGLRLLLLPVVAGIAFEILKWAGNNRDKAWAQTLIAPGLWTQYLTTRVPDDGQLEVAIAALESVWDKEHEAAPQPLSQTMEEPAAVVA